MFSRCRIRLPRTAALLWALTAAVALAQAKPPAAPVNDVVDTHFGVEVHDPYRYMEDAKNPEFIAWTKAQADYTRSVLDRVPQRAELLGEVQKYGDAAAARTTGTQVSNDHIFYYKRLPDENIPKLYVRKGIGGKERLLVDPEAIKAPEGKHYAIDWFAPSLDNKYVAYGLSLGGSEQSVLHVMDVATGKETGDLIDRANFGPPGWTSDHRLLYNRLQKMAPDAPPTDKYVNSRVYLHALGSDPERDVAVLGPGVTPGITINPAELSFAGTTPGSRHAIGIVVNGVQREITIYTASLASIGAGKPDWKKVVDPSDEVTDSSLIGDSLYVLTHKNASRFKVLKVDLNAPDLAKAAVVVPPSESVVTGVAAAKDALYVRRMNGSTSDLLRVAYKAGAKPVPVKLPFDADIPSLAADVRVPGVIYEASAWTRFGGLYFYNPGTGKVTDTGLQPQGAYDNPADLVATEVKVKSHDGTLVPLSIVHRKGIKLDGTNPTIVYGYGAYGISTTPYFRPTWLPWYRARRDHRVRARPRWRRIRRGLVQSRVQGNQAEHMEGCDRVRRVAGREQIHVDATDVDHGRQRRGHLRRPVDHRATRPVRRRDRRCPRFRRSALGIHGERRAQHSGVRLGQDRRWIQGAVCDELVPLGQGWHPVSRSARHHRHQRSARRRVGGRQDGGAAAGGHGERQADPAPRRLRRGPRNWLDEEAGLRGARRRRSRSCCGNSACKASSPEREPLPFLIYRPMASSETWTRSRSNVGRLFPDRLSMLKSSGDPSEGGNNDQIRADAIRDIVDADPGVRDRRHTAAGGECCCRPLVSRIWHQ